MLDFVKLKMSTYNGIYLFVYKKKSNIVIDKFTLIQTGKYSRSFLRFSFSNLFCFSLQNN